MVHLLKIKKEFKNLKETGDTSYIYKAELAKACFYHDMAYRDFKDLKARTTSDKVLRNKAFNIAKNPKYNGYPRVLASVVYNFFDKSPWGVVLMMMMMMLIIIIIIIIIIKMMLTITD